MADKKPTYKEEHGETRVGAFLRKIGKSNLLATAISLTDGTPAGGFLKVLGGLLKEDNSLTPEQYALALKELEMDIKEEEAITKRWEADAASDSYLAKNVRPLVLIFLTVSVILIGILDSAFTGFTVTPPLWSLLSSGWSTVVIAYFGSRGVEKGIKLWKK